MLYIFTLRPAIKIYLLKPNKFDTMSWPYHLVKKSFLLKFDFGLNLSWFDLESKNPHFLIWGVVFLAQEAAAHTPHWMSAGA